MTSPLGILQLVQASGVGVQSQKRLLEAFQQEGGSLSDLAAGWPRELVDRAGLKPQLGVAIANAHSAAARLAEELEAREVRVLAKGFAPYPEALAAVLGDSAPPVLFARGDLSILSLPAVAFCGSRKSSAKGLEIAEAAARELAAQGVNVVSGYANGVDLTAHRAALASGGATTLVLAEGILQFRTKSDIADVFDAGRYLILSEFPPSLKWLARNAMQRNRTICGLANAVLIVESGLEGGTFAAGQTAQEFGRPLFVVRFAEAPPGAEGNAYFLERGATPLSANGEGKPNVTPILRTIQPAQENQSTQA